MKTMSPDLHARAARIRMLLMDVDGVLTDGRLYNVPDAQGNMAETKGFDSQDGIALQWCALLGIKTGVISGRISPATTERARQTKMVYVYQGHTEKIPILEEILADSKIDKDEIAYIGDDLTDVVIMHRVGLGIATANARPEVKREAHYVTAVPGGQGAVREAIELIFRARGQWEQILAKYELASHQDAAAPLAAMTQG
jgi:3-deoxy-D-manno-octulosonate 8-phosphate phosphatase (KDO 8-P phosphatase)